MKKSSVLAAFVALPVLASSASVFADSPGQLANGPDMFQARNITTNGSYGTNATATCNDVVKYSVKLANSEYGMLTGVTLKASLQDGSLTASATNAANNTTSIAGKVNVTLTKGSLSYVAGSTKVLDVNGTLIATAADGITAGGVTVGTLKGSTQEFVQFQAKVDCPVPPVVKEIKVCELSTKKIVTIKENEFDAAKHTKDLSKCETTPPVTPPVTPPAPTTPVTTAPTALVNTGPGQVVALFAISMLAGTFGYRALLSRRLS